MASRQTPIELGKGMSWQQWIRRGMAGAGALFVAGGIGAGAGVGVGRWLLGWGRPAPPNWVMPLRPPIVGAHRGGAAVFPEHTLAAFAECHERYGCRFLELDVRATRDGVPVVIHDATVDRTTDGSGRVAEYALADLQRLDAGYHFRGPGGASWAGRGLRVPTLAEVLARFPDCVFSIELKEADPSWEGAVIEAIRSAGSEQRVLVGSAHDNAVARLQALAPDLPTFYSYRSGLLLLLAHATGLIRWYRPAHNALLIPDRFFGVDYLGPGLIRTVHRLGLPVLIWTVNETERMKQLLSMGADGIITDRPDLLAGVSGTPRAASR